MPLLGSFCLLFALALAGYCFVVGVIAAVRKDAVGYRLAETARRAGMASFLAVLVAAGALVYAALTDDFPSLTSFIIPTARCPAHTNLQSCGRARKARFSSGLCCSPPMGLFCACATRSISVWSRWRPWSWRPSRFSF